jgi:calcium-dependent protein kinase
MIKKMLTYNPEERVSVEEALNDPWLLEYGTIDKKEILQTLHQPMMGSILVNVSKINVEQKLQQACLSYLANYMGYKGMDEDRQNLKEIFKAFDKNGDGHLAYEEILEGYKQFFNGDENRASLEA